MKKGWIYLLGMTLLLSGCAGGESVSSPPPAETPPSISAAPESSPPEIPAAPDPAEPQETPQEEVFFEWEADTWGSWPLEQTVELLQFCGKDDPELTMVNEAMLEEAENQMMYFDAALQKGEEQCRMDGDSWASLWTYPISGERYLSAVTIQRQHYHFCIDEMQTWNLVSSYVYDKAEQRFISLEEAFAWMGVDQGMLEREIWEYAARQGIGTYEKLSSIGFYMDPEGYPVFIIGAIIYGHGPSVGWPTFFNWDKGEIRWSGEEPMPLFLVDTQWEELSCLQGMGQYDGAAVISEQEAFDTLVQIVEVQELLDQGMVMTNYGVTEYIDGEEHLCIAVGTDHDDQFVTEHLYAVSWLSVYCMDPACGEWVPVGFG